MQTFTIGSIPLFITEGVVGTAGPARLKFFDVYYVVPPVVGFHVVGSEEDI